MSIDFVGNPLNTDKCMACEIASGAYVPPGGIIFQTEDYMVHQDPYVAIPGFFIISPKRHIYSVDQMTVVEQSTMGNVIAVTEELIKKITNVGIITLLQEDKVQEGHLHIWVFPWHDYILKEFGYTVAKLREIIDHYKTDLNHAAESVEVAQAARNTYIESRVALPKKVFRGQYLCDQDFSGQDLSHADFEGAILKRCNFRGCDLSFANFTNADLYRATFQKATVYTTLFRGADLTRADFRDAWLYGIKIFDADLTHTLFDDIVQEEKEKHYEKAADVYNTLKRALAENGNKEESAKYYYKQCVACRKQKPRIVQALDWFFRDLLTGYGERVFPCIVISAAVILLFSVIYFACNGMVDFAGSLLCSISLFFGFEAAGIYDTLRHMQVAFLAEQIIGYSLIALVLISLARKIVKD